MLDRHGRLSENLYEFKQMHQGEKESVCVSFLLSYSVQVFSRTPSAFAPRPFQIQLKKPCVVVGVVGGWRVAKTCESCENKQNQ